MNLIKTPTWIFNHPDCAVWEQTILCSVAERRLFPVRSVLPLCSYFPQTTIENWLLLGPDLIGMTWLINTLAEQPRLLGPSENKTWNKRERKSLLILEAYCLLKGGTSAPFCFSKPPKRAGSLHAEQSKKKKTQTCLLSTVRRENKSQINYQNWRAFKKKSFRLVPSYFARD